jgi:hypothetical protein
MTTHKLTWPRDADETWAAGFELELTLLELTLHHHPPKDLADQVLADIHQLVNESGEAAHSLLGDPREYARTVAEEHADQGHRDLADVEGFSPGERFTAALGTAGAIGILIGALRWVRNGLWMDVSWASMTGSALLAVGLMAFCCVPALRSAGRVRGMWAGIASVVGVLALGVLAMSVLPHQVLFPFPAPALLAVSLAVAIVAAKLPSDVADRWFRPGNDPADTQRWLYRLEGLLRARHGMTGVQAREHVQEVRDHLAAAPSSNARQEFGPVEDYAAQLASGPLRKRRSQRRKVHTTTALAAVMLVLDLDNFTHPDPASWWWWVTLVAAVVLSYGTFTMWRAYRAGR